MKRYYWIISVLILLGICTYTFNYFYQIEVNRKIAEILGHQKIHAKQAAKSFNELFEKWNSVLFYLSTDKDIINFNDNGSYKLNELYHVFSDEIKGITRTDSTGRIIFNTPDSLKSVGTNISSQLHMKKILTNHKPVISDVFFAVQGYQAIVIHYPVFKNNRYKGSIAFLLNFNIIAKDILDDIKIGKTGYAWMISHEGIELYSPYLKNIGKPVLKKTNENPEKQQLVDSMIAGKEGYSTFRFSDKSNKKREIPIIAYYIPLKITNDFWSLAICYSRDEIISSLYEFRIKLLIVFLLIFFGGILISYFSFNAIAIVKESKLRIEAEEALSKERTLLRTLIDHLPSGIFVKDKDYKKIIVNPIHVESIKAHIQNFGMDIDNIIGKTDFEVFPKGYADQFIIDDRKVVENGVSIINKIEEGFGPDKNKIWLLISKVPLRDLDGKISGMVGITTDITDQKLTEQALIKAKEKAEESDRLKTAFLNNISHEIRTPLNAIIGFSNLIKEVGSENERLLNYANIVLESSKQLLLIITDIINISTIEAGKVNVNWGEVNINNVIVLLYEQLKNKAELKKIEFSYKVPLNKDDAVIITDQTKFIEILSNLVNNAIKFTQNGHIYFGYELKEGFLEFYVEDTGIGIKPEFYNKIYNRFSQAESSYTNKYGGTGLGLSISKAYIEVLGGKIWFNTIVGEGTTFYFTIPYKQAGNQQ